MKNWSLEWNTKVNLLPGPVNAVLWSSSEGVLARHVDLANTQASVECEMNTERRKERETY